MNCPDWQQQIASESQRAELREHLNACEPCREFAQELEKNGAALRELTIPATAFAAVRQRVLSEIQVKKQRAMWWTWAGAAAAACVAMICIADVLPCLQAPAAPVATIAKIDPPKIGWTLPQRVGRRVHHKSSGRLLAQARPVRKTEPLAVVKMLTDDPNVIIIWLVDQKGDSL
jgi:hypothetical protein